MKKMSVLLLALLLASPLFSQQNQNNVRRPIAAHRGAQNCLTPQVIASGLGIIAAVAVIAILTNNSHAH